MALTKQSRLSMTEAGAVDEPLEDEEEEVESRGAGAAGETLEDEGDEAVESRGADFADDDCCSRSSDESVEESAEVEGSCRECAAEADEGVE